MSSNLAAHERTDNVVARVVYPYAIVAICAEVSRDKPTDYRKIARNFRQQGQMAYALLR